MSDVVAVDRVFSDEELATIHRVRQAYPAYTPSGRVPAGFAIPKRFVHPTERTLRFAPELAPRADVGRYQRQLIRHELAAGRPAPLLSAYLRATYAANGEPLVEGIERLQHHDVLVGLARELYGANIVVPTTIFANVYLPGQCLPAHTDIPAFRGAERGQVKGWILVAMHHSGRFKRWRIPTATVVAYPDAIDSGDFYFYSERSAGARDSIPRQANSAVALDADTVFHGVATIAGDNRAASDLDRNDYLIPDLLGSWHLHRGERDRPVLVTFEPREIRYSLSWKAYCFEDEHARRVWADHSDDLPLELIIPTLLDELAERGVSVEGARSEAQVAAMIIDELIPFPPAGT